MISRAIILAAGRGERLVNGMRIPKPLVKLGNVPLIVRVIRQLQKAGVQEVVVVTGYLGDVLQEQLSNYHFSLRVIYAHNPEFHKPNGTSLLAAKSYVRGETLLMMCDHIWSLPLLERVANYPIDRDEAVLGIDFNISRCFDVDDATKVRLNGDRVSAINKELPIYDALDTGVFKITPALIEALQEVENENGCSLSQGVAKLAAAGKMRTVDVGKAVWVDVDTPSAHAHAEKLVQQYGDELRERSRIVAQELAVA